MSKIQIEVRINGRAVGTIDVESDITIDGILAEKKRIGLARIVKKIIKGLLDN